MNGRESDGGGKEGKCQGREKRRLVGRERGRERREKGKVVRDGYRKVTKEKY